MVAIVGTGKSRSIVFTSTRVLEMAVHFNRSTSSNVQTDINRWSFIFDELIHAQAFELLSAFEPKNNDGINFNIP